MGLKAAITVALPLFAQTAGAQTYFTKTGFGDLVAGFRKTGGFAENYEMAAYLGNITNFISLSVGTTIPITNYSAAQINQMCPDDKANLQWSVFSSSTRVGAPLEQPWVTPVASFPGGTCWFTIPRDNANTQTTPPARMSYSFTSTVRTRILGVSQGANQISQNLGVTNQFNNTLVVLEPVTDPDHLVTAYISDGADSTLGDWGGSGTSFTLPYNVEGVTPDPFDSANRVDLYQFCPTGNADPFNNQTAGSAYYLGYFTLNTDGTMTFTRQANTSGGGGNNPPPQPVLALTSRLQSGQITSTISFNTTNGATYKLYFTNAAGLKTPMTNWPSLTTTITGDGAMHSFTNTSTDAVRFYSIGAH